MNNVNGRGYQATTGGLISLGDNSTYRSTGIVYHCAGINENNHAYQQDGGMIFKGNNFNSIQWDTGASTTTSSTTTQTSKTTKTATLTSIASNSMQGSSWRTDKAVKAGDWGYGLHRAAWFFNTTNFNTMRTRKPTKIELTYSRQSGGYSTSGTQYFYLHTASKQSDITSASDFTNTNKKSSLIGSKQVDTGDTGSITITNSTILSLFANIKYNCIIALASDSKADYTVFGSTLKIKYYYEVEE